MVPLAEDGRDLGLKREEGRQERKKRGWVRQTRKVKMRTMSEKYEKQD